MDNYFNIEKLISKLAADTPSLVSNADKLSSGLSSNLKTAKPLPTKIEDTAKDKKDVDFHNSNNILLTKSMSTAHIPDNCRAKNSKRVYANFDKELS